MIEEPKDNLFEGIQIMSPSEIELSMGGEPEDNSTEDPKEEPQASNEDLSIAPIESAESGDMGDD